MVNNVRILQKLAIIHKDKVLTIKRSLDDTARPGSWDFVGGNVDNEDVTENVPDILRGALAREVMEELGFKVNIKKLEVVFVDSGFGRKPKGSLVIWIGYKYVVDKMPKLKLSFEHTEYKWLTKKEFLKLDFDYAKDSMTGQINNIL